MMYAVVKIEEMQILDNIEVLADELDNISFARKLTRIYKDSTTQKNQRIHLLSL